MSRSDQFQIDSNTEITDYRSEPFPEVKLFPNWPFSEVSHCRSEKLFETTHFLKFLFYKSLDQFGLNPKSLIKQFVFV